MRFARILKEVVWCLLTEGRISYRRIRRDFELDEAGLEDLRHELIQVKGLAVDQDGGFLAWAPAGRAATPAASAVKTAVPAAERRQLTVMFCDLVGSTGLSTRLDPEDLADLIRAYRDATTRIIQRFEGYIAQYAGDGVLAYFGYPVALEREAERAVRTGLAILEAVPGLNADIGRAKGAELAVRIGVASGLVMVGETIGSGASEQRAVIGETPNLAARLQGLARPNGMVISPATRELAGDIFAYEDLGKHALKGISEPVHAWGVKELRDEDGELGPTDGAESLLIGRDEEIGLLRRAWQQTGDECRGRVVCVSGEPGIGKTALIRVVRQEVLAEGRPSPMFRCSPYHTNSSLYPVIEFVRRAARWEPGDGDSTRLDKLEQLLGLNRSMNGEMVSLLAELLSLPVPEGRYAPLNLTPQQLKQRTEDAIVAWLLGEAAQQPLLQVWEDLQWADPTTLDLLGLLVNQVPTATLLLVMTFRQEFVPPWPARSYVTPITLNRLERPQIQVLVNGLAGGKQLPPEVIEHIVRKTDGVPLYVEELTKMVLTSGVLRDEGGRYALTGPLAGLTIPASLQEILMARLDRLPTVREVAQIGAVLGREFAYEMLQGLGAVDEPKLRDGLEQLVDAELLYQRGRPPRATYVFKHALIQDAAYQSLLRRTRQQYHQQVAALLETRFPQIVDAHPELVAHHYTEAGCTVEAITYWQRAGQQAARRSANREVVGHLTRALDLLKALPDAPERAVKELDVQRLLGTALLATRGYAAPETMRTYRRAHELCGIVGASADVSPVLTGVYLFELTQANHAVARRAAQEILARARADGDADAQVVGHVLAGVSDIHLGAVTAARPHLESAISLCGGRDPAGIAYRYGIDFTSAGYAYSAWSLWLLGHTAQARQLREHAVAMIERARHPFTYSRGLYWTAVPYQFSGEWAVVRGLAERALGSAREHGFALVVAAAQVMLGAARAAGGEEAGLQQIREGLAAYQATGARFQRPYLLTLLADALKARGLVQEGLAVLGNALGLVEETGERYFEAEVHRLRGGLLLAGKNADDEVEASYRKALDVARGQQAKSLELRAARDLARLWKEAGEQEDAYELLLPVSRWFTGGFDEPELIESRALLDELR